MNTNILFASSVLEDRYMGEPGILLGNMNLEQIYVGYGGYINYKSNILFDKFKRNIFRTNTAHQYEHQGGLLGFYNLHQSSWKEYISFVNEVKDPDALNFAKEFGSDMMESFNFLNPAVPAVMIQGQIKHMIGSALTNGRPAFLQTYFRENSNTIYNISEDIKRISEKIKEEIYNHNSFLHTLQQNMIAHPHAPTWYMAIFGIIFSKCQVIILKTFMFYLGFCMCYSHANRRSQVLIHARGIKVNLGANYKQSKSKKLIIN